MDFAFLSSRSVSIRWITTPVSSSILGVADFSTVSERQMRLEDQKLLANHLLVR